MIDADAAAYVTLFLLDMSKIDITFAFYAYFSPQHFVQPNPSPSFSQEPVHNTALYSILGLTRMDGSLGSLGSHTGSWR